MEAYIRQEIIDDGNLVPIDNGEDWIDGEFYRGPYDARWNGPDFEIKVNGTWVQAVSMDFELG